MIAPRFVRAWNQAQGVIWQPASVFVTVEGEGTAWCRLSVFNGDNVARIILRSVAFIIPPGAGFTAFVTFAPGLVPAVRGEGGGQSAITIAAELPHDLWLDGDEYLRLEVDLQPAATCAIINVLVSGRFAA